MKKTTMRQRLYAALAAAGLLAAQSAAADTIQLNNFWAGHGSASINFLGTNYHNPSLGTVSVVEGGGSGGFKTYNLSTDPGKLNAFQSWCVDIFHSFNFAVTTTDVLTSAAAIFGSTKANDLGRLYTTHYGDIDSPLSSAANSSAFQLAVWEIVNEKAGYAYNLGLDAFKASGTGSSIAQSWLTQLNDTPSVSAYDVNIWFVTGQSASGWGAQDVAVFTPVPEPQTYAMLLAGLGLMGFVARRRQRNPAG